ncbi:Ubiquitin-protein ligase [Lecanora helva]
MSDWAQTHIIERLEAMDRELDAHINRLSPPRSTPRSTARDTGRAFDVGQFVHALPRVDEKDIPEHPEDVCAICGIAHGKEDQDTGYTEFPVRLPCHHIVGKACIFRWLRKGPEGGNANSCPVCRRQFFQPWPLVTPPPRVRRATTSSHHRTNVVRQGNPPIPSARPDQSSAASVRNPGTTRVVTGVPPEPVRPATARLPPAPTLQRGPRRRRLPIVPQEGPQAELGRQIRSIEGAGFLVGSFTEAFATNTDRELARANYAANRRRIAIPERDLFNIAVRTSLYMPGSAVLMWPNENEPLDSIQDRMLFMWLEDHYAFHGLKLNEQFRIEDEGVRVGRRRDNAEMWEVLRNKGYYWAVNDRRNGRWHERGLPVYTDQEEDESDVFQQLVLEGAFTTRGVARTFRNRDDYFLFRLFSSRGLVWDMSRGVWLEGGGLIFFGDEVRNPQEGPPHSTIPIRFARRLGDMVIRGQRNAFP